jgi:hypothetical protein
MHCRKDWTLKRLHPMSALPPKADIVHGSRNVRFAPITDVAASLDHLEGEGVFATAVAALAYISPMIFA